MSGIAWNKLHLERLGDQEHENAFNAKKVSKSAPWNGQNEEKFKRRTEKFTTYMAAARNRKWKLIMMAIHETDQDASLEEPEEVRSFWAKLKNPPVLEEDIQDMLYDHLNLY